MQTNDAELSETERAGYLALRNVDAPGAALEDRLVESLRRRGLIRLRRRKLLVGAVAAALAAGGAFIALRPAGHPGPRFMLLLYEGPDFDGARAHVEEYVAWAREVRRAGTHIDGEKLQSSGEVLGTLPGQGAELAGFFVIETKDRARAAEIARRCPHLKYRGQIVVRQIED
jgi:hypothetical protein